MDNWIFKALLVVALLMLISVVVLRMAASYYKVIGDTETCECIETEVNHE
jgi:small neutral amino acid transporter SnatA (MarC family)